MNNHITQNFFEKFKSYELADTSCIIGGGNQIINQFIRQALLKKARNVVNQSRGVYAQFDNLSDPLPQWRHAHYRNLSCMLDIPISTLKYYFQKGQGLKIQNQNKVLDFLGFENWETLEKEVIYQTLKNIPQNHQ